MKKMILLLCLATAISVQAQNTVTNEVETEGYAKLKVKADIASFRLIVTKRDSVESVAISKLNKETDQLISLLNTIGFENTDIRISNYNISAYENSYNNGDEPKYYTSTNTLNLSFGLNTKLVDAVYQAIEKAGVIDTEVNFETLLSDSLSKAVSAKLVQMAIVDAKQKAENIATGLGLKLGKVKRVDNVNNNYVVYEASHRSLPKRGLADFALSYKTAFSKLEPEEKELEENITIIFELVK